MERTEKATQCGTTTLETLMLKVLPVSLYITVELPNKGPSEIGTTSLQRTLLQHHAILYLRDRDDLSTRNKIISPKVSLVGRFHCIELHIL